MNLEQDRIRAYCANQRCAKDELRDKFANVLSFKTENLKSYEMQNLDEAFALKERMKKFIIFQMKNLKYM